LSFRGRTPYCSTSHPSARKVECGHQTCAHWGAESVGMVAHEKASKDVLGVGPPDPALIARGEQNSNRFVAVLNDSLKAKAARRVSHPLQAGPRIDCGEGFFERRHARNSDLDSMLAADRDSQ
jgi:hypothetical protein